MNANSTALITLNQLLSQVEQGEEVTINRHMLRLLTDRIATIENRVPALERSTQEIKTDWGLL